MEGVKCIDGLILPIWVPYDHPTPAIRGGKGLFYLCILIHLFIGVSVARNKLLKSIDIITKGKIWNVTVANLTLRALGLSSPQILLMVIEMLQLGFQAGDLGPSTILGSTAFNMFFTTGLCISLVGSSHGAKKIKNLPTFLCSAMWLLFAYIWLYAMLGLLSFGVIELWEGICTVLFFPAMVLTTFGVEKLWAKCKARSHSDSGNDIELSNSMLGADRATNLVADEVPTGFLSWKEQITGVFTVKGEGEVPTGKDYVVHYLTLFWRMVFVVIPPANLGKGYPCLLASLGAIGFLVALICDTASHLGCFIFLADSVSGITLIAFGLSLGNAPTMIRAAKRSEAADNFLLQIVGSMAVDIFLGLGMSWSMAATFWAIDGQEFLVNPNYLGLQVLILFPVVLVALVVLLIRRNAALGGPMACKIVLTCLFIFLWIPFALFSSLNAYTHFF